LAHFNGKEEHRSRPQPITTSRNIRFAIEYEAWLANGNTLGSRGDPFKVIGMKVALPYFEVQLDYASNCKAF
jgi:hypothetical protein